MATVVCHTDGCGNSGIAIDGLVHPTDEAGAPIEPWTVMCGVCGEQITDVTEASAK